MMVKSLDSTADLRAYAIGATELILSYEQALDICNADKQALREWCEAVRSIEEK